MTEIFFSIFLSGIFFGGIGFIIGLWASEAEEIIELDDQILDKKPKKRK